MKKYKIPERLKLLNEEERAQELYSEKCYNIAHDLKNRGEKDASFHYFKLNLESMIIPLDVWGYLETCPVTIKNTYQIYGINEYINVIIKWNERLFQHAILEKPFLENRLLKAMEIFKSYNYNGEKILDFKHIGFWYEYLNKYKNEAFVNRTTKLFKLLLSKYDAEKVLNEDAILLYDDIISDFQYLVDVKYRNKYKHIKNYKSIFIFYYKNIIKAILELKCSATDLNRILKFLQNGENMKLPPISKLIDELDEYHKEFE